MRHRRTWTATLALGSLALVACGHDTSEPNPPTGLDPAAPEFAIASNTWAAKAPLPESLSGVSAAEFPNPAGQSVVYTFGGLDYEDEGGQAGISAYDVATNTWTARPNTSLALYDMNGVGRIGRYLYFSGGRFASQRGAIGEQTWATWAYDPAANRLVRKADMPRATADGVTGVIDGKLWVLPGTCSGTGWPYAGYCDHEPIRLLYRYDPVKNHWGARRACPHYHRNGAGGVIDGKFYVVGGADEHGLPTANLDVYDPATDRWQTLAPLPTASGRAIGTVMGLRLWVITGTAGERRAYVYDRATNQWKTRAAPALDHGAVARVTLDGQPHLLAVGGFHLGPLPEGNQIPNDSELYTR